MKRKKYNIHKDFNKWNKTNPPINRFIAPIIQLFTKNIYKKEKDTKNCKIERKNIQIDGKNVRYLVFTPKTGQKIYPCLIYYHGGGYMLPAAPYHYRNAREYATKCDCIVLVPDYPLAPKKKFPTQPKICYEFYNCTLKNSKELNINPNQIIVGGDSSGGSLASIVCMMASDNNIKTPLAQMLIYPVVGIKPPTQSMLEFSDTGMCNNKDFEKYCKLYFKNNSDMKHRYASSLNQENLSLYPPTYIETAEFDCLRDEGKIFAEKLKEANVEVVENHTKQTIHAYDIANPDNPIIIHSMQNRISFLNNQFYKKTQID